MASRGLAAKESAKVDLWFNGPEMLMNQVTVDGADQAICGDADVELKKVAICSVQLVSSLEDCFEGLYTRVS